MKCKHIRPYGILIRCLFWQVETSDEVMEVDKQLKFKSHKRMFVKFISNNVDVMTHDCLSSVALAWDALKCTGKVASPHRGDTQLTNSQCLVKQHSDSNVHTFKNKNY